MPELLGDYPINTSGDSAQALWELSQRIKRFLQGNWSSADEDLEPLLARLRIDAGGQLLSAATLQRQGLAQANQILITASEAGKYCSGARQSEAGTISKTIVAKYFAGDVQVGRRRCHSGIMRFRPQSRDRAEPRRGAY